MSATAAQLAAPVASGAAQTQPAAVTYVQPQVVTYAQPQVVSYAPPGAVTYAQPGAVTYAQPGAVTYAQPGAVSYSQPGVVYAAAPQPQTFSFVAPTQAQQEPTGGMIYAAPQIAGSCGGVPPAYVQSVQHPQFPPIASMVAYPGMPAPYMPASVQNAWDNHFEAFGKQDLDKIMLDYDEASVARIYDWAKGAETAFKGTAEIRGMFSDLFSQLSDLSTLEAPVVCVEEYPQTVFLCWKCPGSGVLSCTDTFIFGPNFKIQRQNIVLTTGSPAPALTGSSAAAAPVSSSKAGSSPARKTSSAKKNMSSKKKKAKGCC